MMNDKELWDYACSLFQEEGEDVIKYLADRVGEMAAKGDHVGVMRWTAIADRVDELRKAASTRKH